MERINGKIAVLGLGLEGKDVLKYLLRNGYDEITVFDKKERNDLDLRDFDTSKIRIICGNDYLKGGIGDYNTIFRSPGVYRLLPEIIEAERNGSVITSNIKYFLNNFKGTSIGVTGTKGKGTTSTLIYEILRSVGHHVNNSSKTNIFLTGNIGLSPLSILDETDEDSIVVLELSSFQLFDLEKSPNIAVVLNITSDHMDWHKDQTEYVKSKENIVKYQNKDDYKVLNYDYSVSKSFGTLSPSKNYFFSKDSKVNGVYVSNGVIYSNIAGDECKIGNTENLLLRGRHNWENVTAAICATQLFGCDMQNIKKVVFSFKGLEHRLELVKSVNEINYYNDSFSTNPQTTIAAVDSFAEPVTLILGGYDKGLDFQEMVMHLCEKDNLKNIILIGNIEEKLFGLLKSSNFKGSIIKMGKSEMKEIINKCQEVTKKGGVVLLSPAAASFDMFKDYKDRGNQFKKSVMTLV